ncbi:hypothetical protein cyc_04192 [Cyclospora cayetanensis]|uniref:Uncharacterized protein n=1 Tax=Cyclospora cayetanensis TaxID=88456 RepID=A0A1D3CRX7_9EIME|nr:hypothetical protein cyc_04192 [Cyclospora cayetanensis]
MAGPNVVWRGLKSLLGLCIASCWIQRLMALGEDPIIDGPENDFGFTEASMQDVAMGSQGIQLEFSNPVILPGGSSLKISGMDAPAAFIVRVGDCMTFKLDVSQLLLRLHKQDDPYPETQFVYVLKRQENEKLDGTEFIEKGLGAEAYESHIWFRLSSDPTSDWRYFKSVYQPPVYYDRMDSTSLDPNNLDQASRDVYRHNRLEDRVEMECAVTLEGTVSPLLKTAVEDWSVPVF